MILLIIATEKDFAGVGSVQRLDAIRLEKPESPSIQNRKLLSKLKILLEFIISYTYKPQKCLRSIPESSALCYWNFQKYS